MAGRPLSLKPDSTIAEGLLSMGSSDADALAITADGSPDGALQAVVTSRALSPMFGDHPVVILRDIRHAGTPAALRALNQRARAFALQQLAGAASVDWVAQFLHLADAGIVRRLISTSGDDGSSCWSVCGSSGRAESLTRLAPRIVMITADSCSQETALATYQHVTAALSDCDYLVARKTAFDQSFYVAASSEWRTRCSDWIRDPILKQTYRARPLFDLRPIHGDESLWRSLQNAVDQTVDRDFLTVLANDCLASLPPLTFFQDAVVDESGEESPVFRLEQSALRPLVDVGRVFGMAARRVFGPVDARTLRDRAAACCPSTRRSSERQPRRCASCCGSRGASGSARARAAPSCRRRSSAGTIATLLKSGFPIHPSAARVHRRARPG